MCDVTTSAIHRQGNSYQLIRWTGAALLKIEPCLNRISKDSVS
ncbi:MAG: hypothetical protein ACI9E5_001169 [Candidatus Omnitrophota bacterium]